MEKQSISPHPGQRWPSDWITRPRSIAFATAVLFILIFGIAVFLGWRQFNDTRNNLLTADKTTANLLADLLLQHNKANIGILQSYANRPLLINAVKKKDLAGIDRHLVDLKKNGGIDTTYVADKRGILWTNLPVFQESRGKDFSQRDWYKGISAHWKPYISAVFKQIVGDKLLAVTVCVPIFDEKGRPIGILGNSQRLNYINDTIEKVAFDPYTTVNVTDHVGKILYSNKISYLEKITDYPLFPIIEPALKGKKQQIEIQARQKDQEKRYLTVVPAGDIGWTIIIERSLRDILRSVFVRFMELGAFAFLLFLMISVFLVYLRKADLARKTEELLKSEQTIRQRDDTLRVLSSRQEAILDAVPEIIMEVDNNKVYTWANPAGIEFFGEDVIGKEAADYFEDEQETYSIVKPIFNGSEEVIYIESWQRRKDGEKRLLAWWCRTLKNESGQVTGALSSARDITEHKLMETMLRESEEKYRLISDNASGWIYLIDPDGAIRYTSPSSERMTGYLPADFAENHRLMQEIVHPDDRGMDDSHMEKIAIDKESDSFDFRIIAKNGETRWMSHACSPVYTSEGKYAGRRGTNNDITERKLATIQLAETLDSLRKAVGVTIQVMASAIESRDPYTSGHQTRSADLARAIAMEMGLPQDKIEAIRMAGSIHDIGKLSIPAEILSKPTKLSEIELALIKEHANRGYEILKDVVSPWPLAEIVRQHHERMDGSGYPRNLKGDDILIEARILTVADVVEAMASHRPYRPGLGIDAALVEIEKNKGIYYDIAVADACLRLFREKGFKLDRT